MTGCCARHGQEEFFGEKTAANDARKYRRKGPDPMARSLARRAATNGVEGASVLEIGGGIGQVALELLKEGAASAEVVELLPAYEPFVHSLASEAGSDSDASVFSSSVRLRVARLGATGCARAKLTRRECGPVSADSAAASARRISCGV